MSAARQALALLLFSALLALAAQALRPHPLPWRQNWSTHVLDKAAQSGLPIADLARAREVVTGGQYLILDARPHRDYLAGHLPGSLALPVLELERHLPQVLPLLTPAQPLMIYCSGQTCDESIQLANTLRAQGFTNLLLFAGGMVEWQQAGLTVER